MNIPKGALRRFTYVVALSILLLASVSVALTVAGCARQPAPRTEVPIPTPTPAPTPTPEPSAGAPAASETPTPPPLPAPTAMVPVRVYFIRGEKIAVGPARTVAAAAPAKGAVEQLLLGPTKADKALGLGTTIPSGTKLNGVAIRGGTATVDMSRRFESGGGSLSMLLRVTEVVCTLTQFPSIKRVAFKLDGRLVKSIGGEGIMVSPPVTRANFEDQLPAILVESPLPGATVRRTFRVAGSANVFEAQFRVSVIDARGKVIEDEDVRATSGTGTRGTFSASVSYPAGHGGAGKIRFYEPSAKDGTPINVVTIPVRLSP